jgi:sugar phosphate permease
MLAAAISMVGVAFGPTVWVIGAFNWLRAVPVGFQQVVLYAHLAEILDRDELGPVMSFTPVPRNVASFSLPLIAAAIAAISTSAALASGSVLYLVAAWSGWRMSQPTVRRLAELAAERAKREAPP